MRIRKPVLHTAVLTIAACLLALAIGLRDERRTQDYTVSLVPCDGMTILSENPVRVNRGGGVAFRIQLDEGCLPDDGAPGVRYEGGVLYVDNVRESRSVRWTPRKRCAVTVRAEDAAYVDLLSGGETLTGGEAALRVHPPAHYTVSSVRINEDEYPVPASGELSFRVYGDSQISLELTGEAVDFSVTAEPIGRVSNLQERETYRYGDVVALRASDEGEYVRFDGWSEGAFLSDGGAALSTELELKVTLQGDMSVFANYTDLRTYTVTIDPNGGRADETIALSGLSAGQSVYMPADRGILHREGYALVGYNTAPDGSGQRCGLASPLMMERGDVTLYAQWLPETPADSLKYYTMDGYAVVKGAAGPIGDTLVIPSRLGGLPVRSIDENAFAGSAEIKTALIPLGTKYIGAGAFSDCPALDTVYLPDTLRDMGEGAFGGCPSLRRMRVQAGTDERAYDTTFESGLADRYMRLIHTPGKRIILVSGSSGSFGLDSRLLAQRYPDYEIINYSGSYMFGMRPMLPCLMAHIHPGDVVIFAPEYYMGMYAVHEVDGFNNWLYLESDYNMLEDLDLRRAPESVLGSFVQYLRERREILPGKSPTAYGLYVRSVFNEYGDISRQRSHRTDVRAYDPYEPDIALIAEEGVSFYREAFDEITARGGVCLFSFPPISDAGAPVDSLIPAYDAFTEAVTRAFSGAKCTVISRAADYLWPMELFYDNRYHMTAEGAAARTRQLIADLDNYGLDRQEGKP